MSFWLLKSDVEDYSIVQFEKDGVADWTGVRNYQARNFMRDQMQDGDLGFFYHSNDEPSGIAGILKIVGPAKPDLSQFDSKSKYYDEKATRANPRWFLREVKFVKKLNRIISIHDLRKIKACKDMVILKPGNRLSITPVTKQEWDAILASH